MFGTSRFGRALALTISASFAAGIGAATTLVATTASGGGAATAATHTQTITGTAFKGLDPDLGMRLAPNTGGGAIAMTTSDKIPPAAVVYYEAEFALPTGAKITSVSIHITTCDAEKFQFGSYAPGTRVYTQTFAASTGTGNTPCPHRTVTKSGNPLATVQAGRTFAVDWKPGLLAYWSPTDVSGLNLAVLHGATVTYTCTAPCT